MLELLTPFIGMGESSPRLLPAWNGYVQSLETFAAPLKRRYFLATDYETSGIALLRYILSCVDWPYMKHQSSDYDRYMFHVRFIRDDLENTFDHTTTGFRFFNLFTAKNLGRVQEFIIPVEDSTSLSTLPFDKGWEQWIKIRPVRYLTHDSRELTLNVEQDKVRFSREAPNYAIITIDVIALVFKYWKYMTDPYVEIEEDVGKDQRRFLHQYVLNSFIDDQIDTFLITQLKNVAEVESPEELEEYTTQKATKNLMYGFVGSRYNEACTLLYREYTKIKSGNIRPGSLLASPLLGKRKSIIQRVNLILEQLDVPRLRQFQFYRYLRDKDLFLLILQMYNYRSMDTLWQRINRTIKPKIERLIREKIWLYMKDPVVRTDIQEGLESLNAKLSYS